MARSDIKMIGEILVRIGNKLIESPEFIHELDKLLNTKVDQVKANLNTEFLGAIDFYSILKTKGIDEISNKLDGLEINELKFICKKYHFSIPTKNKSMKALKEHIINQFKQRAFDVFMDKNPKQEVK